MRRNVDLLCEGCETERHDVMCDENERIQCPTCSMAMTQVWWRRTVRQNAQWDDATAVMVHVSDDPSVPRDVRVRYVGSHDAKLKPGYRKVYLRNLQEVNRFEREHQVANEVMHFDRNGRSLNDHYRNQSMNH